MHDNEDVTSVRIYKIRKMNLLSYNLLVIISYWPWLRISVDDENEDKVDSSQEDGLVMKVNSCLSATNA